MEIGFPGLLARAAQHRPEHLALIAAADGVTPGADLLGSAPAAARTWTYRELDAWVESLRAGLLQLGLVAGYRIVTALSSGPESLALTLAAWRAGLTVVPVPPGVGPGRLARLLVHVDARLVVTDLPQLVDVRAGVAGLVDALEAGDEGLRAATAVPTVVVAGALAVPGEVAWSALEVAPTAAPLPTPDPERIALILFPAGFRGAGSGLGDGSSQDDAGVMLSHRSLTTNAAQVAASGGFVGPDDVVLNVLPLWHVFGIAAVLGAVLHEQATMVWAGRFEPKASAATVRRHGVTLVPAAPAMVRAWAGLPEDVAHELLGGLRLVISGSAPLASSVAQAFTQTSGVPVTQGYGITEAGPVVALVPTPEAQHSKRRGVLVGRLLPGVEMQVRNADGRPQRDGEIGTWWVRGPHLFSGYWPAGTSPLDDQGWFCTGDVGYHDPEVGWVLLDRLDDVVRVAGFTVYPSEIRSAVSDLLGDATLSVEAEGDSLVARLHVVEGHVVPDSEALASRWREQLAAYKRPVRVEVAPEGTPAISLNRQGRGRVNQAAGDASE